VITVPAVKVCPKCGSENVKADPSKLPQFHAPSYLCLDCGFTGNLFPEIDKDAPSEKSNEKV
jgi:transposase-like protein